MKNSIQLLVLSCVLATSGCGILYDENQDRVAQYCDSLLSHEDRSACKQRNRTSYEEYERERQGVVAAKAKNSP